MRNSTRAALALGLGLFGVAGLVAPSMGQQAQDGGVRQAATGAAQPKAAPQTPTAVIGVIDLNLVARNYDKLRVAQEAIQADAMARSNDLMKLQGGAGGGRRGREAHSSSAASTRRRSRSGSPS